MPQSILIFCPLRWYLWYVALKRRKNETINHSLKKELESASNLFAYNFYATHLYALFHFYSAIALRIDRDKRKYYYKSNLIYPFCVWKRIDPKSLLNMLNPKRAFLHGRNSFARYFWLVPLFAAVPSIFTSIYSRFQLYFSFVGEHFVWFSPW